MISSSSPTHLWLTLHEAIVHPTELHRIFGYEANYDGTSFIWPLEEYLGWFRYGSDWMNVVVGERSTPGGLSTVGWDDEGVASLDYHIVKDGILNDLQTTREQALWLVEGWYRSQGRTPPSPFGLGRQGAPSVVGSPRRSSRYTCGSPPTMRLPGAPNGGALYFFNSLLVLLCYLLSEAGVMP